MKLAELYKLYRSGTLDKFKYIERMHRKHKLLFEYADYLKDTDVESIVIEDNRVLVKIKGSGVKLLVDPQDKRFIPIEMLNFHSIESQEAGIVYRLANNCPVIFDVGANIGWYTIHFCKLPGVCKVFSFEPIPHTFEYLQKHIELNNATKAELHNLALSDEQGIKEFFWTREETGSSSMANIRQRTKIGKVSCRIERLDDFARAAATRVDFIKCDVEGSELLVFRGALGTIERDKPIIFTEMLRKWSAKFGYHPNDIIALFKKLGYDCFCSRENQLHRIRSVDDNTVETNFFFLHNDKHANFVKGNESNLRGIDK